MTEQKGKTIYFEICRIIGVFCIMFQHTGGRGADAWRYTESVWVYGMSQIGRIISDVGVPLFWMVSGALLLPRKESWKKVYGKRIIRMGAVLFLFSVIRYLCTVNWQDASVGEFFQLFYTQELFLPYWFLYEYLAVMLILPFLRKMAIHLGEEEQRLLFILLIGWHMTNDFSNIVLGSDFILNPHFRESVSYFIFGYLMEECQMLNRREKKRMWFCVGQVFLLVIGMYAWVSRHDMETRGSFVMLLTLSIYYVIRYLNEKAVWNYGKLRNLVLWCGSNVFGIYLTEDYLRNAMAFIWEWSAPYVSAVPACGIWLLIVFVSGNVLVSIMRKLPVFKVLL